MSKQLKSGLLFSILVGATIGPPAHAVSEEVAVQLLERLNQLEQQVNNLQGENEVLKHQLNEIQTDQPAGTGVAEPAGSVIMTPEEPAIEGVNTLTEPLDLDTPDLPVMPSAAGQPEPDLSSDAMGVDDIPALETAPGTGSHLNPPTAGNAEPVTVVPPPVAPLDSTGTDAATLVPDSPDSTVTPPPAGLSENPAPQPDVTVNLEQPSPEKVDPQSPDSYYYYGTVEKQAENQATADTATPATPQPILASRVDPNQAKSEYNDAYRLLVNDPAQAIPAFRAFLSRYPAHELAANAQYWLGEALYAQKDFAAASDEFMQVLKLHKDSPKAPGAALKLGYSFYELENWEFARRTLEDTIRFFPDSNSATLARERLQMMESAGR